MVLERNELVSHEQSCRCGMNAAGNYRDGRLIRRNTSLKIIQGLYGYIAIIRTAHFVRRYSKFVVSTSDVALLRTYPSTFFTCMWPCIVTNFFIIKPTRYTNFTNLFWHETLHVSDSSSVHHQEFIHCTLSNGICHTGL